MRVCTVLWDLAGGGAERVALELVRALPGAGVEPLLAVFERRGEYLHEVDVPLRELPAGGRWCNVWALRAQLRALLAQERPDVLHVHLPRTSRAMMRALLLLPRRERPVTVLTVHNNLAADLRQWHGPVARQAVLAEMAFLFRRADAVTAVSQGCAGQVSALLGVPVHHVPNPLDVGRLARLAAAPCPPLPGGPLLVSTGRLVAQKDHATLLHALAILRREVPAHLMLLGQGPLEGELRALAQALGVAGAVHFAGFVANPFPIIRAADAIVMASRWEGFCMALAEALALGRPVVSTDCDHGPREFIRHGENGLLTPVGDPTALAAALERVLTDAALAACLPATAALDPAMVAREYATIYRHAMNR